MRKKHTSLFTQHNCQANVADKPRFETFSSGACGNIIWNAIYPGAQKSEPALGQVAVTLPSGHMTLLRRWINVVDVDSASQQRRVPSWDSVTWSILGIHWYHCRKFSEVSISPCMAGHQLRISPNRSSAALVAFHTPTCVVTVRLILFWISPF